MTDEIRHKKSWIPFGPGLIVTAAFIGPGTVLTASKAGAQYGYTLLWAVGFSVIAAIVLQEMAARLGIVSGGGLSRAISNSFENLWLKRAMLGLVLVAILFGNAAYQTGNLLGAAIGLKVLTGTSLSVWVGALAVAATIVIWIGRFDVLQYVLTGLVIVMSLLFILAAICCGPEIGKLVSGFVPSKPAGGSEWLVVGLIGTTVVPYNLFLHASAAATKWNANSVSDSTSSSHVRASFVDTVLSVLIGGVITSAILVTAAVAFSDSETTFGNVGDIAKQLRPAVGPWAETLFAIGIFAAGLTSSITAPVAAGYAAAGCFDWVPKLSNVKLKLVATLVIVVGAVSAIALGGSPAEAIIAAQVANGLLLPILALFLLITVNRKAVMRQFRNGTVANVLGAFVVLVTFVIAARQFSNVWRSLNALFFGDSQ